MGSKPLLTVTSDAWSQGQIFSKLWLLEALEPYAQKIPSPVIWVLGGWYGLLPFLIQARGKIQPERIVSFDLDPEANRVARAVNDAWAFAPFRFQALEADCTRLDYSGHPAAPPPDIVVNTACEHFSAAWIDGIPAGTLVAIQSTNMVHEEHRFGARSLEHFHEQYPIFSEILQSGEMPFRYPTLEFQRFQIIGRR